MCALFGPYVCPTWSTPSCACRRMRLVEANTVDAYYDITKKETYEVSHNELQWRCKIHLQQLSTGLEPNEPAHQSWQVSKTPIVNGIQVSSVEGRVGMRVIKLRRKQIYPCVVADEGDLRLMNDPARLVIPPSLPGALSQAARSTNPRRASLLRTSPLCLQTSADRPSSGP